jgi:hypothetical protein
MNLTQNCSFFDKFLFFKKQESCNRILPFFKKKFSPNQKKKKKESHWLEYAALTASGWPAGRVFAQ